ncbi:15803_t:CDS:2 [Rhizophagus irregularis]|nr:15803_t:CDS:2 [Rhizophagus irregularis]
MKPSDAITSVASPASSNTTQLWTVKYRKNLEKRSDSWNFLDYGMSFAEIATKEIFRDEYRLHRDRLKNRGGLFLEQLIEPYTNRMMKWSHFLAKNNLCKGPEPLWYKKLSEMVIDVEEDDRVVKHITSFQEILTRENNTKERIIAYIKTKRSRSKNYDEVGKHLIVHEELENENEKFNSPFLVNSTMTKGRKIENSGDESIVKPYMTSENIEAQNESVIESNIKEVKEMDANVMLIDDNKMDSMDNSMM